MKFKYYNPDINLVIKNKKLLSDLNDIKSIKPGMVCGAVRMFNNGDLILDTTPNLVVGTGRQYVAQRLFERAHPAETEVIEDDEIWTWKVSHFAIGNGGSTTVSDYTNLLGPDLCDQDLYNAMDEAVEKLAGQMRKLKTKLSRRVERTGLGKSIAFEEIVSEEGDGEEDEVVRTKSITLKPITLDEAILEMEAINHDFYMYLDTDDEQISVVYKRKEGGYGLIQATNKVNLN